MFKDISAPTNAEIITSVDGYEKELLMEAAGLIQAVLVWGDLKVDKARPGLIAAAAEHVARCLEQTSDMGDLGDVIDRDRGETARTPGGIATNEDHEELCRLLDN